MAASSARGVFNQRVEADVQLVLRLVLVAHVAHAQAGGVGAVKRARDQGFQVDFATLQKRLANRGRRAKQVRHQPAEAQKVANQAKVACRDEVLQAQF